MRIGGSAAIAAVVITGVGAAGAGFTGVGVAPEPSPSASPDLTIDQGDTAYATVPFPEHPWGHSVNTANDYCGEPVPAETAENEGFSALFEMPAQLDLDSSGEALINAETRPHVTLSFTGSDPLPVFVEQPEALFLQDGVVVGHGWADMAPSVTTLEPGGALTHLWQWAGAAADCEAASESGSLDSGEYEMVLVSRVHNSEQTAAVHSLRLQNYGLPARSDLPAIREGAYECRDDYLWGGITPITCQPNALPGVVVDEEAGVTTVPYDSALYSRDVDLVFASTPIPVTLESDRSWYVNTEGPDLPAYERESVPACGDAYATFNSGSLGGFWAPDTPQLSSLEEGDSVQVSFWIDESGWTEAEVTMPANPRLWIMRTQEAEYDGGEAATPYWYLSREVVGWVDTTSAAGDSPLEIIRYDGPEPWSLTVDEVQWCEGVDFADTFATGVDGPPESAPAMIASPATVTLGDGTREELDALVIYP